MWTTVTQWIAVLATSTVFDFAYIAWARAERESRLWVATAWAPVVGAISLAGVLSAVHSQALVIPYLLGQALGTWISVYLRRRGGSRGVQVGREAE